MDDEAATICNDSMPDGLKTRKERPVGTNQTESNNCEPKAPCRVDMDAAASSHPGKGDSSAVPETIRILVVDDEEDFFILIRDFLAEIPDTHYTAVWAASYDAALHTFEVDQFAVWLVDYRLGSHNGLELMRELIHRGNKAPMILMTAQGNHDVDVAAMKIGATDYLPKDRLDMPALDRCVRYALERGRAQEQLHRAQKMEAIGLLAGGVAHDFNNLLTVITGYAGMLSNSLANNPKLKHEADEILASSTRAATLTRKMLALSRKQMLNAKVTDLNTIVGGLESVLRQVICENIELRMQLDERLGPVKVDPGQIEQVIMNLTINARDAMPSGGTLTIQTIAETHEAPAQLSHDSIPAGRYAVIAVTDTGTGMSEQVKRHLFEPFFTTKGMDKGTGLGLATCHGIIKQSGGYIHVETKKDHGSSFRIYLPVTTEVAEDSKPVADADVAHPGTEAVLLVEDEDPVRGFTACSLREAGYTVLEARNGADALRLLREQPDRHIDIIVTDVIMPKMSGMELASHLKQLRPKTHILFISGYTGDTLDNTGVPQSGVSLLEKPFSAAQLTQKIRELVGSNPSRKQHRPAVDSISPVQPGSTTTRISSWLNKMKKLLSGQG
ncbi:MAG: response regulator [Verrucomicrobia bacterium]|nr:response regulator [Verrucomicrobiota bacterium]